jgi:hypothetical protein
MKKPATRRTKNTTLIKTLSSILLWAQFPSSIPASRKGTDHPKNFITTGVNAPLSAIFMIIKLFRVTHNVDNVALKLP